MPNDSAREASGWVMGAIASCQDDLWSPEECVEWIAGKYELVLLSLAG